MMDIKNRRRPNLSPGWVRKGNTEAGNSGMGDVRLRSKSKRSKRKAIIQSVTVLFIILTLTFSGNIQAFAVITGTELGGLAFQTSSDSNILIGETTNIKLYLYNLNGGSFSGNITAYSTDTSGNNIGYYSASGSSGNYTLNNVTFDTTGIYYLYLYDSSGYCAVGVLTVSKPVITITGDALKYKKSLITGTLKDNNGKLLAKKTITLDGSDAGIDNTISCTTALDGTYSVYVTPSKEGTIKFLFNGYEIGTLVAGASYSQDVRIGGSASNNQDLSISVAEAGWSSASTVIVTRDDSLADALASVPLSKKYDAPILMNPSSQLDSRISSQISALGATKVIIIGGYSAISQNIETALQTAGYTVSRISGSNRYETSVNIASWIGSANTIYLAYGQGEPDALAASTFAAAKGCPILLTDKDKIPAVTQAQLLSLNPSKVILLGGESVIGSSVESALNKNYVVERLGGTDRYATEWAILRSLFTDQSQIYFCSALASSKDVTSGKPKADALLAAALAAKNDAIIVAVPQNYLPSSLQYFLTYNRGYIARASIVGNSSSISTSLEKQIEDLMTL
ncbi:cell wall-binding repeat-containing protein [Dehalobacter sp. 12DCB1]|uniref:cell wall-binding repeat-containing protein n=1 Tax=Dehalobacter sp. 12DCB1 TaxID=2070364 RepID=UPI001045CC85|nr:cell wall-binding repeat-containing protein [Dehalobacter sp. 12DCB1]TCX56393.1 cell wall-binding repeat-containing protein [Dehalobacter sp. 12DCB1]